MSSGRSTSSLTAQQRRSNKVSPALPSPSPASLALPPPLPHPALSACLPPAPSPSVPSHSPYVPSGLFCCLWNDHIPLTDSCLLYSAMHILMYLLPPHRWFILSFEICNLIRVSQFKDVRISTVGVLSSDDMFRPTTVHLRIHITHTAGKL